MTLLPMRLERDAAGAPYSALYGDIYASRDGALGQAMHVFLGGCGLPEAWRGRHRFVVLETGFGLGANFLATWQAWRDDPQRPRSLHFVSVELHPLAPDDLVAAAPAPLQPLARLLARQWPLPLPGVHRLEFDHGRVVLTLAFGDARRLVPQLVAGVDAIYLDGFAPDRNPAMWEPSLLKAVSRLARPGARLATYTSARAVRAALAEAGFEVELRPGFGRKREMLVGRYAPRWRTRRHEPASPYAGERAALVIGAGLAGSACAHALSRRGWNVQVLEAAATPAAATSALPWGLLHPQFSLDDAPLERLTRAGVAAAHAARARTDARGSPETPAVAPALAPIVTQTGTLQIADGDDTWMRWCAAIDRRQLPPAWVECIDVDEAARRLGIRPRRGGLWWPGGAAVATPRWCRALLSGSELRPAQAVHRLVARGPQWQACDGQDRVLAAAPVVIVATALQAPALLGLSHAPLRGVRGRVALLRPGPLAALRAPISGDGTLLPHPDGGASIGATFELALDGDAVGLSAEQALASNLARAAALLADAPPLEAEGSFDGLRCVSPDRLPLAGAVADETAALRSRGELRGAHLEDLARQPGTYASFALGSRGLTLAPLLAELIAARIEGEPLPVERDLAAVVDPARYLLHRLRRDLLPAGAAPRKSVVL